MSTEYTRVSGGTFWKPTAAGDLIEGLYRGKEMREGGQYGPQEVATLEIRGGDLKLVTVKAGLKSSFESSALTPGKVVKIIYQGKQMNPRTGRTFDAFEVFARDAVTPTAAEAEATARLAAAGIDAEDVPF